MRISPSSGPRSIGEFSARVKRYVTRPAWSLARRADQAERLRTVLYSWAIAPCWNPADPLAGGRARVQAAGGGAAAAGRPRVGGIAAGTPVQKSAALFRAVEVRGAATRPPPGAMIRRPPAGPSRRGSPRRVRKIDLRVAEVVAAERVPKSKKLLKLTVVVGGERRTLAAGIAEHYEPAALVGRKVVVVANLEPATLMGIESNGMVLAGSDGDALALLSPDRDLPPGARVS